MGTRLEEIEKYAEMRRNQGVRQKVFKGDGSIRKI